MSKKSDRGTARPKIEKEQPPKRYAISEPETKPCGCIEVMFSDETVDVQPCIPHGLMQAAQSLITAGQALGAIGTRLHNEELRQRTEVANAEVNRVVEHMKDNGCVEPIIGEETKKAVEKMDD